MITEYTCIKEDKIAELETRADWKDKRLDEIDKGLIRLEDKIDHLTEAVTQLQLQFLEDNRNLDRRVGNLETTVNVLKYMTSLLFGSGVLFVVLKFIA